MNFFPFRKALRAIVTVVPGRDSGRLRAVWVRDPRTGRLIQTWREVDDDERSCTRRPRGPRSRQMVEGGAFKRAA